MDLTTYIGMGLILLCLSFIIYLTIYSRYIINRLSEKHQVSSRQIIQESHDDS